MLKYAERRTSVTSAISALVISGEDMGTRIDTSQLV
jgi:hypothetical protein